MYRASYPHAMKYGRTARKAVLQDHRIDTPKPWKRTVAEDSESGKIGVAMERK